MVIAQLADKRPIEVRAAVPSDRTAVLALMEASLGWSSDEHFEAFFVWKHEHNAFGPSPAWVAVDEGNVDNGMLRLTTDRAVGAVRMPPICAARELPPVADVSSIDRTCGFNEYQ